MCGIVGLFLKNPSLRPALGACFTPMLNGMSERGPDSAGIAIYHDETDDDACKVTLFHPDSAFPWSEVGEELGRALDAAVRVETRANHAVFHVGADAGAVCDWVNAARPEIRVMGYGHSVEIFKDKGTPQEITARYGVEQMAGTHAIGHTRMATESAVTTEHSHPFIADVDACLVHNGSLSNHNRLRRWLSRQGMRFESDNDTEVAARYFAYRLKQGASLKEAMEAGLTDLDGFFTFAMGTRDGFAVLRDGFACKPAVLAETDDWVAMASEFRSLADLPGVDGAHIWEPEPENVYSWDLESRT